MKVRKYSEIVWENRDSLTAKSITLIWPIIQRKETVVVVNDRV